MKVALSPRALADLKAIARWIGTDNPGRAESFSTELRQKCATLARQPRRFPSVYVVGGDDIRKRVHGNYAILYRVQGSEVEILRIVHAARDWLRVLTND